MWDIFYKWKYKLFFSFETNLVYLCARAPALQQRPCEKAVKSDIFPQIARYYLLLKFSNHSWRKNNF